MKRYAFLLLCSAGLFGCPQQDHEAEVALVAETGAPPTLSAELVHSDEVHTIRMSEGVAMAVNCWDYCTPRPRNARSCSGFEVTSDNKDVITVREAFRANGKPTFVLSAAQPGIATVTAHTACGSQAYTAKVEPAP